MAIHVRHTYSTFVEIIYYPHADEGCGLHETTVGNMDELCEHIYDILVHHNFAGADVCSSETGEILMTITRD